MIFTIRDYGIGITEAQLRGMRYIGNIHKPDIDREILQMPVWLRPTGDFGIGLQSIFYVVKSFKIITRSHSEKGYDEPPLREMTFYSCKTGGEIDITRLSKQEASAFGYGTRVEIRLALQTPTDVAVFFREQDNDTFGNYDVFGDYKKIVADKIKGYFDKIYSGSLIWLREFNISSKNTLPCLQRKQAHIDMMQKTFGAFCVLLKENLIKYVDIQKQPDSFSCWNSEHNILIVYNRRKAISDRETDFKSKHSIKIFYKGIHVNQDDQLQRLLNIPFWDTEIHLFHDDAGSLLRVNRETILPEKTRDLANNILKSHLCCMETIFDRENISDTRYHDLLVSCFQYADKRDVTDYYAQAWRYTLFMLHLIDNKKNGGLISYKEFINIQENTLHGYSDEPCVPFYILYNKILFPVDHKESGRCSRLEDCFTQHPTDVWFVSSYDLLNKEYRLEYNDNFTNSMEDSCYTRELIVASDLFAEYKSFAIKKVFFIKPEHWRRLVCIYQLGARDGGVVDMQIDSYWEYVINMVLALNSKGENDTPVRLAFPGNGMHPELEVVALPKGLEYAAYSRFDSWLIAPFASDELYKLLSITPLNEDDILKNLNSAWLEQSAYLVRFIRKNSRAANHGEGCNATDNHRIMAEYRKWLRSLVQYYQTRHQA